MTSARSSYKIKQESINYKFTKEKRIIFKTVLYIPTVNLPTSVIDMLMMPPNMNGREEVTRE